MRNRVIFVVVLLGLTAIAAAPGGRSGHALAQAAENAIPATCVSGADRGITEGESAVSSFLAEGLPPGLVLSVLADQPTELWPPYADSLALTFRRVDLGPGAVTEIRRTQGPLLFYIEAGTVGVSVNGRMQSHSTGGATLVETGQHYLLRNESDEPASVLRLALVPPDEETTVGRGEIAQVIDVGDEIASSPSAVESRLLMQADIPAISGTAHLFLACLSWADPVADPGEASHPGPVGFLVLDGQVLVGESGALSAGDCTLFPTDAPRRLRAGDPSPTVLMFGAAPGDRPLWAFADVSSDSQATGDHLAFDCGGQAAPVEPPAAAGLTPGEPAHLARL